MSRNSRAYPLEVREKARELRYQGLTYREIIVELGGEIPKNTISGWVADIELTTEQKERIRQIELEARARGRPLAAEWHREQKQQRLQDAEEWATPVAEKIEQDRRSLLALAAGLWLGEGVKSDQLLSLANSDPGIIRLWLGILRTCFVLDEAKLACRVVISEGMPDEELKEYWSSVTGIPLERFQKTGVKKVEQLGNIRREGYKGVCNVIYYSAELRRQVGALADQLIRRWLEST